ncbi:MAG: DMT family transporter [Bacteroidota bacterium]
MISRSSLNYYKAISWFVLSLIISCINDTLMKYIGSLISPWQVAFFRCFFSVITLLPFMLYQGSAAFATNTPWLHLVRGGLLFLSISLWGHGIKEASITTATIMSFTVPIFVLLLAPTMLQEQVAWPLWAATLLSFGGIFLVLQPEHNTLQSSIFFLLSAMLFGCLDVLNKKYVHRESILCLLFYATLVATILLLGPAWYVGILPARNMLPLLLCLGIGNNLLLYCILSAFRLTSIASLAPFRYLELLFSMGVGFFFFQEIPSQRDYWGAAIIILCTLFIGVYQRRNIHTP